MNPNVLSEVQSEVRVGMAPVPPPSAYPEQAGTTIVGGPVVVVPVGAVDKEAAVELLAWMMAPEILAEAA